MIGRAQIEEAKDNPPEIFATLLGLIICLGTQGL
jgi:hypothetical protein